MQRLKALVSYGRKAVEGRRKKKNTESPHVHLKKSFKKQVFFS